MLVYHGSNISVSEPDYRVGRSSLDFGKGFYVTGIEEQAIRWAKRKAARKQRQAVVSIYDFNPEGLSALIFEGYTEEWMKFIIKSRTSDTTGLECDYIYGNVADDSVLPTVADYLRRVENGTMREEDKASYLYQLSFSVPNDQYCIRTMKGLSHLTFLGAKEIV